jgi:biotin operon repressor
MDLHRVIFINKDYYNWVMKKLQNKFLRLWLIIGIVAGFAGVVFFVINYLQKKVLCEMSCTHSQAVVVSLILIALFGLFVGSLMYYFMSERRDKAITNVQTQVHKDAISTLKFLGTEERVIMKLIIKYSGSILQSKLHKETGLSRVIISRNISSLEKKGILLKKQSGMTNTLSLNKDLQALFCEDNN